MRAGVLESLRIVTVIGLSLVLVNCGGGHPDYAVFKTAISKKAPYSGVWAVTMTGKSDSCGYGMKGQKLSAAVSIAQSGSRVKVTIQGLGKTYKGTVSNGIMSAGGTYVMSPGQTLSGSIKAKLKNAKSIKITSASLKVKSGSRTCTIVFSGAGSR